MAKFVLMFHGGESPEEPSPEVMDRWMAWFGGTRSWTSYAAGIMSS